MGDELFLIKYLDTFDIQHILFSKNVIPNQAKSLEHFYGHFHRPLALLIHH